jgi:DNA-binding NtrC family response regulator
LFGHVKGAFTDAKSEKIGLFEYAQNGTLFLDEVGSLSSSAQAKLLKILEDKKLRRVGDIGEKDINVRVVAATNINFEEAIREGRFREDLYFRLNLLVIEIPPLRERPEDIPPLAEHYLGYYAGLYGSQETVWSQPALQALKQHSWPGNVRELCNVIERVVLLSKGREITAADIESACKKGRVTLKERQQLVIEVPAHGISLDELESNIVKQVLDMCEWNKSEAARFLKISRPRLRRILEDSGLEQNRRKQ